MTGIQEGLPNASGASSGYLKIMSIPKHLGAYSVECYNTSGGPSDYPNCPVYRSSFDAIVDDMDLREAYFPGWQTAVEQGNAQGVMCSYNAINGVPSCCNGDVLRQALETDWGLRDGFVISDADAVALTYTVADQKPPGHKYATSLLDAAVRSLLNGTSISLEDDDPESAAYVTQLPTALARGLVSLSDLQAAARRALTPRFRVGLYDPPERVPWNSIPASVIDSEAHHALARRAAAESYVLLKNNGVLPLQAPAQGGPGVVAVVGPAANCSGCSIGRYTGSPRSKTTVWEGVSALATALGARAVYGGPGGSAAVAAVAASDVAVVVLTGESEGESHDRERIGLPAEQETLLAALLATGTPLVVCTVSGGAVASSLAAEQAAALIAMYSGGMEAGAALADVLYGRVNPSGALAATVYRESWINVSNFLDMSMRDGPGRGHRYLTPAAAAAQVLYPFGWGLSYTQWSAELVLVSPTTISAKSLASGANVSVQVAVHNTGDVVGARAVYLLLSRPQAPAAEQWPHQWLALRGFTKLHAVEPGTATVATLIIGARDLSRWDSAQHAFVVAPGSYVVALRDCNATASLLVTA